MTDVAIHGEALRDAAALARRVVEAFASAGSDAHDAAFHVGHDRLARAVINFADGWDIRRAKYSAELGEFAAFLEAVADTFADLDDQCAVRLRLGDHP